MAAGRWPAVLLAIALAGIAHRAPAQADNRCAAAGDFAAKAICQTPALDELDRMLRSTYEALLGDSSAGVRDRAVAEQSAWRAKRDACRDIPCLDALYHRRIEALAAELARPDPESVATLTGEFYGLVDHGEDETVLVIDDGTHAGARRRQIRLATPHSPAIDRALAGLRTVSFDPASPAGGKIAANCTAKCAVTGTAEQYERDSWRFAIVTSAEKLPDSFDFASLPADQPSR